VKTFLQKVDFLLFRVFVQKRDDFNIVYAKEEELAKRFLNHP
jgi:hypothetical protein